MYKFCDLRDVLNLLIFKANNFSNWRVFPGFDEENEAIEKNPPVFLENYLNKELEILSEMFNIEKGSALILGAILSIYIRADGVSLHFINVNALSETVGLQPLEIIKYQGEFEQLQNQGFINIRYYNFEMVRQIGEIYSRFSEYYRLSEQISPILFFNLSFELTESFVKKIN